MSEGAVYERYNWSGGVRRGRMIRRRDGAGLVENGRGRGSREFSEDKRAGGCRRVGGGGEDRDVRES